MRYIEADESLTQIFLEVLEERFSNEIQNCKYKLIFDTSKRTSGGSITLASISVCSERLRFFTKNEIVVNGYDYLIVVDMLAWGLADEKSKRRILSHELCHVVISGKGKYGLKNHDIEDFHSEIKLNQDDPQWREKLGAATMESYEDRK